MIDRRDENDALSPEALLLLIDDHARGQHADEPDPLCPECAEPDAEQGLPGVPAPA